MIQVRLLSYAHDFIQLNVVSIHLYTVCECEDFDTKSWS